MQLGSYYFNGKYLIPKHDIFFLNFLVQFQNESYQPPDPIKKGKFQIS